MLKLRNQQKEKKEETNSTKLFTQQLFIKSITTTATVENNSVTYIEQYRHLRWVVLTFTTFSYTQVTQFNQQ